jgi:hypothetical protein
VYEFANHDMLRAIKYVNDNVARAHLPPQRYPLVVQYGLRR